MTTAQKDPSNAWIKNLPRSKMHYPKRLRDRAKYMLWRAYTPCHPLVRDTALMLGVVKHAGRQNYPHGFIAPHVSLREFVEKDDGEIISLRKVENFTHQYHIRIFADGEVRGHYEFTPECYPYAHIKEIGQEDRTQEFAELFGDRVAHK